MRLVTFRRGRGEPKPGALWQEHVLDLGGLAKDLAVQRGTVRRGRGDVLRALERRHVYPSSSSGVERLIAACARDDAAAVRTITEREPSLVRS